MYQFFELVRRNDVSGVSGTGVVAIGFQHTETGVVFMAWIGGVGRSIGFYESIEQVEQIHGHNGNTNVCWRNDVTGRISQ